MLNTRIWAMIRRLSVAEVDAFGQFVASPYHNQRAEVKQLYRELRKERKGRSGKGSMEERIWSRIFPGEVYSDRRMRYLRSDLHQLLQQFLVIASLEDAELPYRLRLLRELRSRGHERSFGIEHRKTGKRLDRQSLRHADYHQWRFAWLTEGYHQTVARTRSEGSQLEAMDRELDLMFISRKLRHACTALTHRQVSQYDFRQELLNPILELIDAQSEFLEYPAVRVYYYGYKALTRPAEEQWFAGLRRSIQEDGAHFPQEEWRDVYLIAINCCIRQLNAGRREYLSEVFRIYQQGLVDDVFSERGYLSRFTYNNMVNAALGLEKFDWAFQFIREYAAKIEPQYREETLAYNLAIYHYQKQEYDAALEQLRVVHASDALHSLDVRRMMVRIYYETGETQALISLLDSFKNYLYRKKSLGYHREHYLNFLSVVRRLLDPDQRRGEMRAQLRREVEGNPALADRNWLLSQLKK